MTEPFWAVLEMMGHVRMAGKVSEEEHFGAKVGRIDVPVEGDKLVTVFFGGGSIYRLTPCDEATARAVAVSSSPAPISRYEMPLLSQAASDPVRNPLTGEGPSYRGRDREEDWDDADEDHDHEFQGETS